MLQENPKVIEHRTSLAGSHQLRGEILSEKGQVADAIGEIEQAVTIGKQLVAEQPTVTSFQIPLGVSLDSLGQLYAASGQLDKARTRYELAREIWERMTREASFIPKYHIYLSTTLNSLAKIDLKFQQFAAARDRLLTAVTHQKLALERVPESLMVRDLLADHYTHLRSAAVGLNDAALVTDTRRKLAELAASDSRFAELDTRLLTATRGKMPTEPADLLTLAPRAHQRQQFALATHLYSEGFATDSSAVESRQFQHAYNAACGAVLAASGRGVDEPPLDDAAKVQLRGQALAWLQAELDRWATHLESITAEERQVVVQTLEHRQADADLAGVRDAASLAALPEHERSQWAALWERVRQILSSVSRPAP